MREGVVTERKGKGRNGEKEEERKEEGFERD